MITDEAVEAAADIVYRTSGRKRVMSYEQARPTCIDEARQILEAAAPHMAGECEAEALEEATADYPTYGPNRIGPPPSDWLSDRAELIRKGINP